MWINASLDHLTQNDTIVLANNRQVLAFQNTWGVQKGNAPLPKVLSWRQYLQKTWRLCEPNSSKRLLSAIESRTLIGQSMLKLKQQVDHRLLDEVVKNNNYCHAHLIQYSQLKNSYIRNCELFANWLTDYQKTKSSHHFLDTNDLSKLIIEHSNTLPKPYLYGFKTLTPEQSKLFNKIGYQLLCAVQTNTQSDNKTFQTSTDEILSAAQWARDLHAQHPQKHIAIVSPNLNQQQHQITSIFNQTFADTLVETGKKSYNISLGLPLTDYPLIRHILTLLKLCAQLQNNRINTDTFNAAIASPYIAHAQQERPARAVLCNRVLSFSQTHFKFARLERFLDSTPTLKIQIERIISQPALKRQSHDQWLSFFNDYLQILGFATNRTLSSTEYQLFKKYQASSLGLNQLAQSYGKVGISEAILNLEQWLSQVIFQAQSAETPIQILGSLEAEGLHYDAAWVLTMTNDFLPAALNSPRFIPADIAKQQQIPHSSFELIAKDAQDTLNNLINLSDVVIFSYAKSHKASEQQPSPLLKFDAKVQILTHKYQNISSESLADIQANQLTDKQVHGGVSILKDQMECAFKGFAHRLNTQIFDDPHIGLDRREQGKIVHNTLQYFYQEITSQASLLALSDEALNTLIEQKIVLAIKHYADTGFKAVEKIRIKKLIHQFIACDKQRAPFTVISTEETINANIAGLKFSTRLDRLDEMENGDRIVFDYKIGKPSVANWCGKAIKDPQLPIYAISNNTQGVAFIQLNADKVSIKGLSKDPDSLPKQSSRNSCADWDEQKNSWQTILNTASEDFQTGKAAVLPIKTACDYCDYDALCRVER
ncbi:FIG01199495: hypothetical protein [uncultured Candidatus Thioglobus sp.]|nr:FIG01199495: hypothetical protein [uncultured Candidatus Thioglobus sp.]